MSSKPRVLIAHHLPIDASIRSMTDYEVYVEQDPLRFEARLRETAPDVFVMELDGADVHSQARVRNAVAIMPSAVLIVAVTPRDMASAAEAMEQGARGFVLLPLEARSLALVIQRELEHQRMAVEVERLRGSSGALNIPGSTLDEIEKEAILRSLDASGGSTGKAAKMLGISVRKIQYRLREWQQDSPELFQRKGNRIVVKKSLSQA